MSQSIKSQSQEHCQPHWHLVASFMVVTYEPLLQYHNDNFDKKITPSENVRAHIQWWIDNTEIEQAVKVR